MDVIDAASSMYVEDDHDDLDSIDDSNQVYANREQAAALNRAVLAQRGDSADEVDPRKLHRDPTLSEIRWYYRRTFANVLVDKPIDDAFKNGFDVTGDAADEALSLLDEPDWEGEGRSFEGAHRYVEKQARRDGFALLFIGTRDNSEGTHVSPISNDVDVESVTHLKALTVDDLTDGAPPHSQIQDGTGLELGQYDVRETGIVINTDITSPDYRTPVGYVIRGTEPQFIHADRVLHYTWNPEVSGDFDRNTISRHHDDNWLGMYEGDSVLVPTYNLLKGLSKGNWSVMQALYRNAANMYAVYTPPDVTKDEFANVDAQTTNINAKSSFVFPSNEYEMEQFESGDQLEPDSHYEVIFDQICAGHEMTKSVLFGTQAGTVSGSEVDIKNYFNKVERYRSNRAENFIHSYLTRVKKMKDSRTADDFRMTGVEIEWGPLFKVDEETRLSMMQTASQALSTAIGKYVLTPDEAREILSANFTDVDLSDLSDDQYDVLDRIQFAETSQPGAAERAEAEQEGREQGGMEQGQQTANQNPTAANADSGLNLEDVSSVFEDDAEFKEMVADRVADKLADE